MSNHDIAKDLDISVPTVLRYIGKQGGRMPGLAAFRDTAPVEEEVVAVKQTVPLYDPKPVIEKFSVGNYKVELDSITRIVTMGGDSGEMLMSYDEVPELVQFLVWAMKNRMEDKQC